MEINAEGKNLEVCSSCFKWDPINYENRAAPYILANKTSPEERNSAKGLATVTADKTANSSEEKQGPQMETGLQRRQSTHMN